MTAVRIIFSNKLFDGKSVQDVLVIFSLVISTKLVTHYNGTPCFMSQASMQIFLIERTPLEIKNSVVKLRVIQHNIKLQSRRIGP